MPTYIMLSTLAPEGVQTIKNNPSRIREVNREVEQLGATVKAQWATLGQFDFVNVIEAPDEKTMARISLELGSRGTAKYETLMRDPDRRLHWRHLTLDSPRVLVVGGGGARARADPGARALAAPARDPVRAGQRGDRRRRPGARHRGRGHRPDRVRGRGTRAST